MHRHAPARINYKWLLFCLVVSVAILGIIEFANGATPAPEPDAARAGSPTIGTPDLSPPSRS